MKLRKFFLSLMIVFMLVVPAWAKITPITIGFELEEAFVPFVFSYKLFMKTVEGGDAVHVATLDLLSSRDWTITNMDLPPGKTVYFSLAAVYEDGLEDVSVDYPFKSTGQPVILYIKRQK